MVNSLYLNPGHRRSLKLTKQNSPHSIAHSSAKALFQRLSYEAPEIIPALNAFNLGYH